MASTLNTAPSRLIGKVFHKCLKKCVYKAKTIGIHSLIVSGSRDVVNKLFTTMT